MTSPRKAAMHELRSVARPSGDDMPFGQRHALRAKSTSFARSITPPVGLQAGAPPCNESYKTNLAHSPKTQKCLRLPN